MQCDDKGKENRKKKNDTGSTEVHTYSTVSMCVAFLCNTRMTLLFM